MLYRLSGLVAAGVMLLGASACTTQGGSAGSGSGSATPVAQSNERVQLSRSEVLSMYTGQTLRGSGHYQTYKADGTWVGNNGNSGRWSVAPDGTLIMTGDVNLKLAVFREGNRFYHRNTRTGDGGYYSIG